MTSRFDFRSDPLVKSRRKRAARDPVKDALLRCTEEVLDHHSATQGRNDFRGSDEMGHAPLIKTVRCDSQYPDALLARRTPFWHTKGMEIDAHEADSMAAIGERLRRLRTALGFSQEIMAERHGVESQQAWGNYERGERPLDYRIALSVAQKEHASLDWIYRGLTGTLTIDLADKIAKADSRPRGRPRKSA